MNCDNMTAVRMRARWATRTVTLLSLALALPALALSCGDNGRPRDAAAEHGPGDASADGAQAEASSPDVIPDATPDVIPDAATPDAVGSDAGAPDGSDAGDAGGGDVALDAAAPADASAPEVAGDAAAPADTGAPEVSGDGAAPLPPCAVSRVDAGGDGLINAQPCNAHAECASNHCVDGVCCDSACDGTCASCFVTGHRGTCTPVTGTVDLDSCAGDQTCGAAGACLTGEGQPCTSPAQCAFGFCVTGRCCASADCRPTLAWQRQVGGTTGSGSVTALAAAADGSIYAGGLAFLDSDLDPSPACTAKFANARFFVLKLDRDGRYVWARVIPWSGLATDGANSLWARAMVVTMDGGVAVMGTFSGTVDFDPTAAMDVQTGVGTGTNVFLSKYAADGTYAWTRTYGPVNEEPFAMARSADGGFLISGIYSNTVDFDPGPGTAMRTGSPIYEPYLLALDSNGVFRWVATLSSTSSASPRGVATAGPNGDIFWAGGMTGSLDVDPGPAVQTLTAPANGLGYLLSLDAAGNLRWVRSYAGNVAPINIAPLSGGDIIVQGEFSGTADFDPQGTHVTATAVTTADTYLSRLGGAAGAHQWTRTLATYGSNGDSRMVPGPGDSVFMVGRVVNGSVDVDPGAGVDTIIDDPAGHGYFLVQLSSAGAHLFGAGLPFFYDLASGGPAAAVVGGLTPTPAGNDGYIRKYAP